MIEQTNFDVVIVGCGPAGCGIASGLWHNGIKNIAMVDKPLNVPFRIGESATPDIPMLLSALHLKFDESHHLLYTRNLVGWGSENLQTHDFIFRGKGNGWHLDRASFDASLRASVAALGVSIFSPNSITAIAPIYNNTQDKNWQLQLNDGKLLAAKIVVDASGRSNAFCNKLGIKRTKIDSLIALACRVDDVGSLQGASFINASEYGWWYAVNLNQKQSLVTLMTDAQLAKNLSLHRADLFKQAWIENKQLAQYVVPPSEAKRPHSFAAYTSCLQQAAGKNWLAVGDALMSFDPLTSSGISGALHDAVAAVPVIQAQLQGNYLPAMEFAKRANRTFNNYLLQRAEHYGNENRWPNSPFWRARTPIFKITA